MIDGRSGAHAESRLQGLSTVSEAFGKPYKHIAKVALRLSVVSKVSHVRRPSEYKMTYRGKRLDHFESRQRLCCFEGK